MSAPGDPGYRPTQWGTAGDHDKRIRDLEALVASGQGCGVPCPPWTVDYDTGEVTGTTYGIPFGDNAGYPVPLILQIVDPAAGLFGPVYWGAATPLVTNVSSGDGGSVIGAALHAAVDGIGGTAVGALVQTEQTGGGTSLGIIVEVTDSGDGVTMDGLFATVTGGVGSVTGVRVVASASDPTGSTVIAGDFDASGGDVNWAGYFRGNVHITNTLYLDQIGDFLTVQLLVGASLLVRDSTTASIFEVREDGSVHILTGTSIVADL